MALLRPLFSLSLPSNSRIPAEDRSPFAAVSIRPMDGACASAMAARGHRALASEAPLLPLPECDRCDSCDCRYQRHADRRRGPRRAAEGALPSGTNDGHEDRRRSMSRRAEDHGDTSITLPVVEVPYTVNDTYFGHMSRTAKAT